MTQTTPASASVTRSYQTCLWIRRNPEAPATTDVEMYIRSIDSVFYLRAHYPAVPTLTRVSFDTYERGINSPRPFRLFQEVDHSCVYCLLALVYDLCEVRGLDAAALFATVVKEHSATEICKADIETQAIWEGFFLPRTWSGENARRLIEGLRRVDLTALADELELAMTPL